MVFFVSSVCLIALQTISSCGIPNSRMIPPSLRRAGSLRIIRPCMLCLSRKHIPRCYGLIMDGAGGSDWRDNIAAPSSSDWGDRAVAVVFLLQGIVVLSFMGLAQRYAAEFYPFLIFAFLFFLRSGR